MPRTKKAALDQTLLAAALEGLLLQKTRLEEQIRQVKAMMGKPVKSPQTDSVASAIHSAPKRKLSVAARKTIAQAQKKRWAAFRKQKEKAAGN